MQKIFADTMKWDPTGEKSSGDREAVRLAKGQAI